jgi:glycosyltransferase involved in cell wall biosynthesis
MVFTHVGRFEPVKNHNFLLDAFKSIADLHPAALLLLVGDGPEKGNIQTRANELGIAKRVIFAGARDDVPEILLQATDMFVFPSTTEGLPMAVVEAQAAGIPCLISDCLTREVELVPGLVRRIALSEGPLAWAEAALAHHATPRPPQQSCLETVEESDFNILRGAEKLSQLYVTIASTTNGTRPRK